MYECIWMIELIWMNVNKEPNVNEWMNKWMRMKIRMWMTE